MTGLYPLAPETVADSSILGSKAASLVRIMRAGLPTPGGFVLAVTFFEPWMAQLRGHPRWRDLTAAAPEDLPGACAALKTACESFRLDAGQSAAIAMALEGFSPGMRFAVRSSSPEEDLDTASFAGAYETVLDVARERLEAAVRRCFASALDARIALYKRQMGLPLDKTSIAVIVQRQLASEVAGVAFSINPLNNDHDEALLNANWGQGESVVSGQVSPDSFVVDKTSARVLSRTLGSKEISFYLQADGGVVARQDPRRDSFCLDDRQVVEVIDVVKRLEAAYGLPVDVEWAFEGRQLHLLQVRPITAYQAVPADLATPPGARRRLYWDLTISVHGMFDPLSPLGASVLEAIISAGRRELYGGGRRRIEARRSLPIIAGGRQYLNLGNFVGLAGRDKVLSHLTHVDPLTSAAFGQTALTGLAKPEINRALLFLSLLPRMAPRLGNLRRAMTRPAQAAARWEERWRRHQQALDTLGRQPRSPAAFVSEVLARTLPFILRETIVLFVASRIALGQTRKLFPEPSAETSARLDALELSLPGNLTIEMGLALHALSHLVPAVGVDDPAILHALLEDPAVAPPLHAAWRSFIATYGHRGPTEVDVAAPRFREAPELLVRELGSFVDPDRKAAAPSTLFENGRRRREEARRQLAGQLAPRLRPRFERLCAIVEALGGFRETHKFVAVHAIDRIRGFMLKLADDWVREGWLRVADDIFYLELAQIDAAARAPVSDLGLLVMAGKERHRQAGLCKTRFPLMDSRGRFYMPPPPAPGEEGEVAGHAVSTGRAIGRVKVLSTPSEKPLLPGEILVARATDPGWTPLFVNAAGIILEVGGALQHGALVAREYGKPCVSGVQNAIGIFEDGEEVEVDGNCGVIRRRSPPDPGRRPDGSMAQPEASGSLEIQRSAHTSCPELP